MSVDNRPSASQETEERKEAEMTEQDKKADWLTIREVEQALEGNRSSVWLRRVITESEEFFQSRRKEVYTEGGKERWVVSSKDVEQYKQHIHDKDERTERRKSGEEKSYTYVRPTKYTYNKMMRTIDEDLELTKEQKTFLEAVMMRYNRMWEEDYKDRKKKRNKNKSES